MPITFLDDEPKKSKITFLDEEPAKQEKPELLDVAAGGSPEENMAGKSDFGSVLNHTIQGTGKDLVTIPAHFFNQMLLNLPRETVNSLGYKYPEKATSPTADILAKGAGIAGAVVGAPGKLISKIPEVAERLIPRLAGGGIVKTAVKGAIAGAAGGVAYTPPGSGEKGDLLNLEGRKAQAIGGALVGGAIGAGMGGGFAKIGEKASNAARYVRDLAKNVKNVKDPVKFSQSVRGALFETKKEVGKAFETGIKSLAEANPDKTIDLSGQVQSFKGALDDIENNPGLASEIKSIVRQIKDPEKSKFLRSLIDNPDNAKELTLQQAQDIKSAIQNAPSIASKLKQGKFANWKSGELELLDLLDEVKLAQSEAFPEMASIRKPYAEYMQNYREVKNMFKPKVLLDKIRTGFGNEEVEQMVKAVLPEETFGDIKKVRTLTKAIKATKIGTGAAVAVEGGRRIAKAIFK